MAEIDAEIVEEKSHTKIRLGKDHRDLISIRQIALENSMDLKRALIKIGEIRPWENFKMILPISKMKMPISKMKMPDSKKMQY